MESIGRLCAVSWAGLRGPSRGVWRETPERDLRVDAFPATGNDSHKTTAMLSFAATTISNSSAAGKSTARRVSMPTPAA